MLVSPSSRRPRPLTRRLVALATAVTFLALAPAVPAVAASASAQPAAAAPAPSGVRALGAALANVATGRRLWSRDLNVRRPMGSITKVMTALVVLKAGHLNRDITVTSAAVQYVHKHGASSAGLVAGDVLTVRQLLEAMLLPSGCDAAFMLATAYGPGRTAFEKKMNKLARTMGMTSTHFANFAGLPLPTDHSTYSTPKDLVRLGEAAMRFSVFATIVAQRSHFISATQFHHRYSWHSTDQLLGSYRGAIGIKTGTTLAAGDCLLFEARRGSRTLIGVVLHANPTHSVTSRYTATKKLLNWGFSRN
jgi:D-alanyl-D-alanine carboxypeptidase (penicillin-binding protein 5/6)